MGRSDPLNSLEGAHPAVILRPANAQDSGRLLEWRNDPDSVRFSITRRAVSQDEHERWFETRLADADTLLWIAEQAGTAVGQVRVDTEDEIGTVSIAVSPDHRGRGLASSILRAMVAAVSQAGGVRTLRASVDGENVASLRAFENAGFRVALRGEGAFVVLERPLPG